MKLDVLHTRVGYTRSKQEIFCTLDPKDIKSIFQNYSRKGFTSQDFFDSYAVFEYLAIRSLRRDDVLVDLYSTYSSECRVRISDDEYNFARETAQIVTILDVCRWGRSLVNVEFLDF